MDHKGLWCALRCSGYFFLPPYTTSSLYYHGSFFGLSSSFSLGVRSFELPLLQPFISKCGLSSSSDMRERASFEIWPSKAWAGRSVEPNLLHANTSFAFLYRPPWLGWLKFRKKTRFLAVFMRLGLFHDIISAEYMYISSDICTYIHTTYR